MTNQHNPPPDPSLTERLSASACGLHASMWD